MLQPLIKGNQFKFSANNFAYSSVPAIYNLMDSLFRSKLFKLDWPVAKGTTEHSIFTWLPWIVFFKNHVASAGIQSLINF